MGFNSTRRDVTMERQPAIILTAAARGPMASGRVAETPPTAPTHSRRPSTPTATDRRTGNALAIPMGPESRMTTHRPAARIPRVAGAVSDGATVCHRRTPKGLVCLGFGRHWRWVSDSCFSRGVVLRKRSLRRPSGGCRGSTGLIEA